MSSWNDPKFYTQNKNLIKNNKILLFIIIFYLFLYIIFINYGMAQTYITEIEILNTATIKFL